jgi:replicative DNA helicase
MITESFLNSCFSLLLNKKSKIKRSKALYRDILDILEFYKDKETVKIPIGLQNKVECLTKITTMLLDDRTIDNIFDSISFSEKFKQYRDYLDLKVNEELKEQAFQDIVKQVRLRKKINGLFLNYDELNKVLEIIKNGNFDSIDDLVEDYEQTIRLLYSNMMESNRAITIEASASLDFAKDDFSHVIEMIRRKYERVNTTPTGFPLLDNSIMHGGFEPSRLYIFGGGSGAGKSTIINNIIARSSTLPPNLFEKKAPKPGEINRVYVYITLENTIEEALMRTYQPMFDKSTTMMLGEITQGVDIKKRLTDELSKNGSTIVMKYFAPMTISVLDLGGVLDDVIEEYGKNSIAGIFIDYLDLLKTDIKYDMYRLELGHITLSLKTLAVQYNIPVITASQLGRGAYRVSSADEIGVDLISESIKKIEHADFVMLLAADRSETNIIHGKVGKNRSGRSGVALSFNVDFSRFKFISITEMANSKKPDATTKSSSFAFPGVATI